MVLLSLTIGLHSLKLFVSVSHMIKTFIRQYIFMVVPFLSQSIYLSNYSQLSIDGIFNCITSLFEREMSNLEYQIIS
jgi:hypothetical protein